MKPARVLALSFPLAALLLLANAVAGQDSGKAAQVASGSPTPTAQTANTENIGKSDSSESKAGDRKTHFHLGSITVGAAYGHGFYPYGPYGFYPYESLYDPFWSPFWGYYGGPNLAYNNGKGEVKLAADPEDATVYVDGAYAGTAKHLKNIWLDPGAYDLSVSAAGRETFQQRVYVLSGKTLKLSAKLAHESKKP